MLKPIARCYLAPLKVLNTIARCDLAPLKVLSVNDTFFHDEGAIFVAKGAKSYVYF